MNRAQRREQARREQARRGAGRTGRGRKVAALGSAAALASAGAGAAMVLTADVAGANAPIVVDSLDDNATVDSSTTLREAITLANNTAGQDEITFSVTGTILLGSDLPEITEALHITGPGPNDLRISGQHSSKMLHFSNITSGTNAVTGLGLYGGNAGTTPGGGIRASDCAANLDVTYVAIAYSSAEWGGGIGVTKSTGTVTISSVVMVHNTDNSGGGGAFFEGTNTGDLIVNIDHSLVAYNSGNGLGGGIRFYGHNDGSLLSISDSLVAYNTSLATSGGGIEVYYAALELTRVVVQANTAYSSGGGVSSFAGYYATPQPVSIVDSTISGNTATGNGGGLYFANAGVLSVSNSTLYGNQAGNGAAIFGKYYGELDIAQSTITANVASNPSVNAPLTGGVVWQGPATVGRPTPARGVSRRALRPGGAGGAGGERGPVAGPKPRGPVTNGRVSLSGTILAGNNANGGVDLAQVNSSDVTAVGDHSLIGTGTGALSSWTSGGSTTELSGSDLKLGPLDDNGGWGFPPPVGNVRTMALLDGSPAIDAGPSPVATFTGNEYDERGVGFDRVVNGTVDVGAFEVQPVAPAGPPPPTNVVVTLPPGSRSATVTWDPPASGDTPTGYQVRCMPVGTPFDTGPNDWVRYQGSATPSVQFDDLVGGVDYHCLVTARYGPQWFTWGGDSNEGPKSDWSNTFSVPVSKPVAPTGAAASTPPLPSGQATQVSFTVPVNHSGAPITRFDASCASSDGGTTRTGTAAASPVGVANLSKGKTYRCSVTATNVKGTSVPSGVSAAIVVPAAAPTGVSASAPTASNRRTYVQFTKVAGGPPVTTYLVRCVPVGGGTTLTATGKNSGIFVTNLVKGTSYRCSVNATYNGQNGAISTPSNQITVPLH